MPTTTDPDSVTVLLDDETKPDGDAEEPAGGRAGMAVPLSITRTRFTPAPVSDATMDTEILPVPVVSGGAGG